MRHYPFHIGDYRSATAHLTDAEDLAYRRLLDHYYDTEAPIPLDLTSTARRLRVSTETLSLVLKDFFIESTDGWHHERCDIEIDKYQEFSISGRRGAEKRWGKDRQPIGTPCPPLSVATDTLIATKNQEPTSKPRSTAEATASRLPADWVPCEADIEFIQNNRPDLDVRQTADRFRDYWCAVGGQKGRKLNWSATWRNWVRNESGARKNGRADRVADTIGQLTGAGRQDRDAGVIDGTAVRVD